MYTFLTYLVFSLVCDVMVMRAPNLCQTGPHWIYSCVVIRNINSLMKITRENSVTNPNPICNCNFKKVCPCHCLVHQCQDLQYQAPTFGSSLSGLPLLGLAIQYVSIRSTIFNASICKARIVNNGAESEVPQMVREIDKGSKWLLLLNLAGFQVAFEVVKHRQKYYFKA